MIMKILFVKGDTVINVRLSKFIKFFRSKDIPVCFWGWDRSNTDTQSDDLNELQYLLKGGGFGKKVALYYPLWMLKVFWRALFSNSIKDFNVVAVNFDSALPIFLASIIRRFSYIYEIRDEFALSYNFSPFLKGVIRKIDHVLMRNASFVIHVDANRVTYEKCKYIIIENSPEDYYKGGKRSYNGLQLQYAVIGNMTETRGIDQVYEFAKVHDNVSILLVGSIHNDELKSELLSLKNVEYHDFMPQRELYSLMGGCCGIFSLFDPCLEINRLAASNKVYDAMMLGIPVITNKEVLNSDYIVKNECGLIVNYRYDHSWDCLAEPSFLERAKLMGEKGREIYLRNYQFDALVEDRLLPLLQLEKQSN